MMNPGNGHPDGVSSAQSPARRLENWLAYQLRRAQEASFSSFVRRLGDTQIWPGWFAMLTIIDDNPHITQTALSKAIQRDKSTLTASLRQLMKAELVQRDQDPTDGRRYGLTLTSKGKAHLEHLKLHANAHDRRLDEIVGIENKPILLALLKTITQELGRDLKQGTGPGRAASKLEPGASGNSPA